MSNKKTKKKNITEEQHFVPRFYLKSFIDQEGEVHIYNAERRRIMKKRGPRALCKESFFYAHETGKFDEVSQEIEDFFSDHVENPISKELPYIIEKIETNKHINGSDKYTLAMFMNIMWMRNPEMRKDINGMNDKIIRWVNETRFNHSNIDTEIDNILREKGILMTKEKREEIKKAMIEGDYDINLSNQSHLRFMLDAQNIEGFSNLFFAQDWIVHISKCKRQFVTSDNPVNVITPKRKGFYGATFLERTHIFPITPHILIEATYPNSNRGKKIKRKTHFNGSENEIDKINLKIASQAKYLYSSRKDEIVWFDKYAKKVNRDREHRLRQLIKLMLNN